MSEQTITARIELKYDLSILAMYHDTTMNGIAKAIATRDLSMIDQSIVDEADDAQLVDFKIYTANRKRVLRLRVDVTYIVPETRWLLDKDQILEFKDPIIFTNAVLPALDNCFANDAFDIKASRVKFFI
jgi:hypothetical protein